MPTVTKVCQRLGQRLDGGRVYLRPFNGSDITPVYLGWLKNPEVVRFSNQRFRNHTEETCRQYLSTFVDSENHFLAICESATNIMVGTLTVYRNLNHGTADIGIMVGDPRVWGKGIGLDAFSAVVKGLEQSGEVRKITAGTLLANLGMIRILERAGFKHEATRYGQELVDGVPVDVVYYAKFCDA